MNSPTLAERPLEMPLSLPQLTLALFDDTNNDLTDYVAGPNQLAFDALSLWLEGEAHWYLMLTGKSGTGKSHLIEAAVRALDQRSVRAMYLPLREIVEMGPEILDGLESIDCVAIDDIDLAAGDLRWEQALFNLFNRMQSAAARLLVSTSAAPRDCHFQLADLSSRLTAGLSCPLIDLNDEDKQIALQRRARTRGLSMPDNVARYLISHLRRDMHELTEIFERIDAASLSTGRELTVPFVRDVLGVS